MQPHHFGRSNFARKPIPEAGGLPSSAGPLLGLMVSGVDGERRHKLLHLVKAEQAEPLHQRGAVSRQPSGFQIDA